MQNDLHKLSQMYSDAFREPFPFYHIQYPVKKTIKIIKKCLREGKPFEVDNDYTDIVL